MTVSSRLGIALSAFLLGLYVVAEAAPQEEPKPLRTLAELCAEVDFELQRSVQQGLLSQSEARTISERCYLIP